MARLVPQKGLDLLIRAIVRRGVPLVTRWSAAAAPVIQGLPADHVDKPIDDGGDPDCGLSNHEGPRLKYFRRKILDVVQSLTATGPTEIYTTHYLEEAEELCDRVAIIDHGSILAMGTVTELQTQLGEGSLLTVQGRFAGADLASIDHSWSRRSGKAGVASVVVDGSDTVLAQPAHSDLRGRGRDALRPCVRRRTPDARPGL